MHLVHFNTAYGSVATAKTRSDGLAVIGIMFQADHNNHKYDPLQVIIDSKCHPFNFNDLTNFSL